MSAPVRDAVIAAVRERGPIGFDEYMELALYGAGGFYERHPVGADGDFVTSPHVHPVFMDLMARAIRPMHEALGTPNPFRLTEVGAGDGALAAGLTTGLSDLPLAYVAVERSPGARAGLETVRGVTVASTLEGAPHLVLAHELLDNLAFRRFRGTTGGTKELRIGLAGDRLVEVLVEPEPVDRLPALQLDEEATVPDGAFAFVDDVAALLQRGYALLIDYGDVGSAGGEVHGYRGHRLVEDLLADPGSHDITCGVDFGLIARRATQAGLTAFPSVSQHRALRALGFEEWVRDELARQAELLDARDGLGAVRAWTGRSRATLLADPAALGRFRWQVLATPGLDPPDWLVRAAR